MKKFFLPLLLLSFFLACSAQKTAKPKVAPTTGDPEESESKVLAEYSLEQFGEALNVMRVILDKGDRKGSSEFCDISLMEASLMSQQLRFLIEEKIDGIKKPKNPPLLWRECKQTCSCYVYSQVYGGENEYFENQAKAITNAEALECGKRSKWFCGSSLHNYLSSLATLPDGAY